MLCDKIHIQNFRCFEDFRLEGMGQVCLIAGKNNVGKTSLLEAVFLLVGALSGEVSVRIDKFRGLARFDSVGERIWQWQWYAGQTDATILIEAHLGDARRWIKATTEPPARISSPIDSGSRTVTITSGRHWKAQYGEGDTIITTANAFLVIDAAQGPQIVSAIGEGADRVNLPVGTMFPSHYRNVAEEAQRFDAIIRQKQESSIIQALQVIEPRLEDLRMGLYADTPVVFASVAGLPELVPITHLGDGVGRLFRYLTGIAAHKGGVVLIDEVENGFHHALLTDVWKVLCAAVRESEVQLIATTHSRECIEGACNAFREDPSLAASYHRLFRTGAGIEAASVNREGLDAALSVEAEVR